MTSNFEKVVRVWKTGRLDYKKGLKLQEYLATFHHNLQKSHKNTLLCLEHPPVYTTGIRSDNYDINEELRLKNKGAEFYRTNRGGLITYHGPGQLVVYPILNLKYFKPSMKWYVSQIENTIIDLCRKYNLNAETSPFTGVWIGDNKICAIGIHGSRFITTHGLALNCNTDLNWFNHIVPCGIQNKGVTSLSKELNRDITTNEVIPQFIDSFCKTFECEYVEMCESEANNILTEIGNNEMQTKCVFL